MHVREVAQNARASLGWNFRFPLSSGNAGANLGTVVYMKGFGCRYMKGFGCRPSRTHQLAPWAGFGKPLEKEPAGSGVWRWFGYGDLAAGAAVDECRGGLWLADFRDRGAAKAGLARFICAWNGC